MFAFALISCECYSPRFNKWYRATAPPNIEPLLTQNKSFLVYIYKDIGVSTQRVYVVKSIFKKTEILDWFKEELSEVLEDGERHEILLRLLEHHDIGRLDWAVAKKIELDKEVWEAYVQDLKNQKPIQYILGYEFFAGEKYIVDANVLIPRPETEELVHWIFETYKKSTALNVLEIGTGSGCIAISLKKKLPQANILATDISTTALDIAQQNAQLLQAEVKFIKDDILNSQLPDGQFDVIVSNPPYIPIEDAYTLASCVKDYEPNIALFTKENTPLQFYEAILKQAKTRLKKDGHLFFEVHEDYADLVKDLARSLEFKAEIKEDLYGKQRMIRTTHI